MAPSMVTVEVTLERTQYLVLEALAGSRGYSVGEYIRWILESDWGLLNNAQRLAGLEKLKRMGVPDDDLEQMKAEILRWTSGG